jgi:hypothetical protein
MSKFKEGNKAAEKITRDVALELLNKALDIISDDCYFLSDVAEQCETYRQKFDYISTKFADDEIVFDTVKRIYNKCESIVMKKTAEGDIVPSLGIFVLKAYHGLMESSKHYNDHTTDGQPIKTPEIIFRNFNEQTDSDS